MIMAGGTGGHVFPALAVARRLRERGVTVVWLGTRRGLEARTVPGLGFDMEWVSIRGLRGKGVLGWLLLPLRLTAAMVQVVAAILRRRPDALLGMGGFVSGPGGLVACLLDRPLLIHEQNAVCGLTNRWLARCADRVLTGFPSSIGLRSDRCTYVGNPVRAEIAALPEPAQRFAGRDGQVRLLVIGGSQGARVFNEIVPQALAQLDASTRPIVRHQCGRGRAAETQQRYAAAGIADAQVAEFVEDMAQAYAWADLVVCRAGAMTVAELAAAGLGAVLVPYAHAVSDHQAVNAAFLTDAGAAVMLREAEFDAPRLAELLRALSERERLADMAARARTLAQPAATEQVAQACMEMMRA